MGFKSDLLICTTLECETKEEMMASMEKAKQEGANLVELCIHSLSFSHISEVEELISHRSLPSIVSFSRSKGKLQSKKTWLQVLKLALEVGVEFVEIDFEEATDDVIAELMNKRSNSKIIISSYLNGGNPCKEKLGNLIIQLQFTGADAIKLDMDVAYITDVAPIFHILTHCQVRYLKIAARV